MKVTEDIKKKAQEAFEQKLNYRCSKEVQVGEGPGSCGGASGGDGKKESAPKESASKSSSLDEKTNTAATAMMGRMSEKYKALDSKMNDLKKGMKNPDSPRNKKQLRDIEKKRDAIGKQMDQVQKVIDKTGGKIKGQKAIEKIVDKKLEADPVADREEKAGEALKKEVVTTKITSPSQLRDTLSTSIDRLSSYTKGTIPEIEAAKAYLQKPNPRTEGMQNHLNNLIKVADKVYSDSGNAGLTSAFVSDAVNGITDSPYKKEGNIPAKNSKTFERVSDQSGKKATTTITKDKDGSFKIGGIGFNGETVDTLVSGIKDEKEAETLAEMIVEGAQPGEIAAELEKPVFSVTHGKTEDGSPIAEVKLWRQDGLLGNFVMEPTNGKWQSTAKKEDALFGPELNAISPLVGKVISETAEGKESHMQIGEKLSGRFRGDDGFKESDDARFERHQTEGVASDLKAGVAKPKEFKAMYDSANDYKDGEPQSFHQVVAKKDLGKVLGDIGQYNNFNPAKITGALESNFGDDTIKVGRESSAVVYVDKKVESDVDMKALTKEVGTIGRRMKADEASVKLVDGKARIRYWWD